MFYYFYFELNKILMILFSNINYNFYYKLTFFLNSFLDNIYLNLICFSIIFPHLILFFNTIELYLNFIKVENYFNLSSLLIGYYNIHPLLLYLSVFFFFCTYIYKNIYLLQFFKFFFYCIAGALLLGGFWGAGNGVWGYFWVNDIIEQILFWLTIMAIFFIHFYLSKQYINVIYIYLIFSLIILLLLRIGLLNTRHSFFDTTNLNNIFIFWNINFIFLFFNLGKFIIILITGWILFYFITILLIYLLLNTSLYSLFIIFLHILICSLGYTWIKYNQHNISWKFFLSIQNFFTVTIHTNTQNYSNIFIDSKNYLTIFNSNNYWFFIFKQYNNCYIFFKYIVIIFLFFIFLF